MAYALFNTTQHSRVYQDVIDGVTTGFCKTSAIPMHYQSVHGSGDYDTVINLAEVVTDDTTIDGYVIENMDWKFGIQTAISAGSEPAQGTIRYRGGPGPNEILLNAISMGYMHFPTRAYTVINSNFDYTTTAPGPWTSATRNLATHPSIPDVITTSANKLDWDDVWIQVPETITSVTNNGGVARFNFNNQGPTVEVGQQVVISGFITNTAYNGTFIITSVTNTYPYFGRTYFEVASIPFGSNETGAVFNYRETNMTIAVKGGQLFTQLELGYGVIKWIKANQPPITTLSETYFGILYEIDVTDIPRVYQNGVLLDWADDFTDEDGEIYMRDSSDNLIGVFSHSEAHREWGGLSKPITKRFYKDGATNYMFAGQSYESFAAWNLALRWQMDMKLSQDPEATTVGMEGESRYNFPGPVPGPYVYPLQSFPVDIINSSMNFGSYFYFNSYQYNNGFSFKPAIPFNASLSGAGEYAKLQFYNSFSIWYRGNNAHVAIHADVGTSKAPKFLSGYVRNETFYPIPNGIYGAPIQHSADFMDSKNFSAVILTTDGNLGSPISPLSVDLLVEEVTSLTGWQPGNRMRFRSNPYQNDEFTSNRQYVDVCTYNGHQGPSAVMDIVYTVRTSTRKPGVDDTPGLRNRLVSRIGGPGSNDASFRAGDHDLPAFDTFDNKNRNRFS